ncbi:MAG: response regulator [Mariprofundaceae bacterium]|nr:response regulator [Mariprofundaceae bacterium]
MKTILLVEDSGSSRDITSHFLQQGGFRVLEAEDGQSAINILKDRHVDLILTDIMMPNMDGWTLYKEVRKHKRFNLTPFVFLSVLDELDDQIRGLSLGVDDYIPKPVTPPQLIARVNTALMRSERLNEYFYRNPVTDLATAYYMRDRLARETLRCREFDRPLSLLVFGIGDYVSLVRAHAEWFAQAAVEQAGMMLKEQMKVYEIVADMGQGRFAILMPERSEDDARAWAEKVKNDWKLVMTWPETEQKISIDVGFTVDAVSPGSEDSAALLKKRLGEFERKW